MPTVRTLMAVVGTVVAVQSEGLVGKAQRSSAQRPRETAGCLGSVLMGGRSQRPVGVRIRAKKGSQNGSPFL